MQELSAQQWFGLFRLRSEVFVVEQDCVYLDMDHKDASSIHLGALEDSGSLGDAAAAIVRLVPPGISYAEPSIGRVAIGLPYRGTGLGVELMERAIRSCERRWPFQAIRISAQEYLIGFYQRLGFQVIGESYLEDNIPHIEMLKPACDWVQLRLEWEAAASDFEEVLRRLDPTALNGDASDWGGLQVLEHLRISEKGMWGYLEKKSQAEPTSLPLLDLESDERGWRLLVALASDRRWKDPTPQAALTPKHGSALNTVDSSLRAWRASHQQAFERCESSFERDVWWTVQVFNHPLAGRISLADTLRFGAAHIRHHIHQLNRLNSKETPRTA